MLAPLTDLGATRYRVPSHLGPLDSRCSRHRGILSEGEFSLRALIRYGVPDVSRKRMPR
jgi:hypothetical protein